MSDKPSLSDINRKDKRGGFRAKNGDKAPPWVMLKPWSDFAPAGPFDDETPAAEPRGRRLSPAAAAVAPARRAEFRAG